jgi:hypothetical protein
MLWGSGSIRQGGRVAVKILTISVVEDQKQDVQC